MAKLEIQWHCCSEKGNREQNEDSCDAFIEDNQFFALVADGLGGHSGGMLASTVAIKSLRDILAKNKVAFSHPEDYSLLVFEANQKILDIQKRALRFANMRTTLVMLHIVADRAIWLHCGDSRLYHIRDGRLLNITIDHSVAQMSVLDGDITHDDIVVHPDRNRLTRSLGGDENESRPRVVQQAKQVLTGDRFLLCSDGWWEYLDETKELLSTRTETPENWVRSLLPKDIDSNHPQADNRSAIGIMIG